ncbi:MAG: LAO/AO transport system kinase [Paraglaciecola sp.]
MSDNKISTRKKKVNSIHSLNISAKRGRTNLSIDTYIKGITNGDRVLLSRAITLIESTLPTHQAQAQKIIEACLPFANNSVRIGVTGTPGVGKSTFIEAFGTHLTKLGKKVAVLAIDPSSQMSRGSILGDKTRMENLSSNENAFIRPSPAANSLGGVARKTRETIILCEAAGFDTILIETVGVGQSEIAVHSMVDFFLLLLLPGAGDELQGIKRGIVEMADLLVVNKADGDRLLLAKQAKKEYRNAIHLFPPTDSGWIPKVDICSALNEEGIENVWKYIVDYQKITKENTFFEKNRKAQAKFWLHSSIQDKLRQLFYENEVVKRELEGVEKAVLNGEISSFKGADDLLRFVIPTEVEE